MASAQANSSEPHAAGAHLARVVGLDRQALLGMQLSVEKQVREGKSSQAKLDCIKKFDSNVFVEPLAAYIDASIPGDQVLAATGFYETPAGVKFSQWSLVQLYSAVGASPREIAPQFTATDQAQIQTFVRTPAGQTIVGTDGAFSPDKIRPVLSAAVIKIVTACNKS